MPFALLLALIAMTSGTLVTYLYDRDASLMARVCAGTCTGFAALGLVGFIFASWMGMTPLALALAATVVALPPTLFLRRHESQALGLVRADFDETVRFVRRATLHPNTNETVMLIFYALVVLLLWLVFGRAMYETPTGIFTGVDNNLGDLPLHVAIVTGFVDGENFPPQHPEYAGVRLTYPFMVDFVTAIFTRAGASLEGAMFWQNFALGVSLIGLLHRWALKLTRDRVAALLTVLLVCFSGGFGWWMLIHDMQASGRGLFDLLGHLPHDYTINTPVSFYRWGNALTTLLVPQRGLLFGLPLAIIVWTLWWQAIDEGKGQTEKGKSEKPKGRNKAKRRNEKIATKLHDHEKQVGLLPSTFFLLPSMRCMIAAGAVAGLLPLVHAHTFMVMMGMGGCLALLFPKIWRAWAAYFVIALLLALPQVYWATRASGVHTESFFGWEFGWHHEKENPFWFWLNNTGVFIPLLVAALAWRGHAPVVPKRLLLFFLPFTLCFVVPNLYKLAPWVWDNIKILFYWYVAAVPLVALLLARLWRKRWPLRALSIMLLILLTLAGSLDVWRVVSRASEQQLFDRDGIEFAEMIKRVTPPRSRILHAPVYNHPVFLSGRRSLMGYDGHLWTHGIDYKPREAEIRRIYAGAPAGSTVPTATGSREAEAVDALLRRNLIEYIVVGPPERQAMNANERFFERFSKVGEAGDYRLYQTARR